jgi:hypothetical protein
LNRALAPPAPERQRRCRRWWPTEARSGCDTVSMPGPRLALRLRCPARIGRNPIVLKIVKDRQTVGWGESPSVPQPQLAPESGGNGVRFRPITAPSDGADQQHSLSSPGPNR